MTSSKLGKHSTCHHRIYRLTCEQFDELLALAGEHCQVCGIAEADTVPGYLYIDHDNRRGDGFDHVRGLACAKCNSALRFVDNGFREATPEQDRYLKNAWFWRHHPSPSHPKTLAPASKLPRKRKAGSTRMPIRQIRASDDTWEPFCEAAVTMGIERSALIRDFMAWYVHRPGAKLPTRPTQAQIDAWRSSSQPPEKDTAA